MINFLIYIVFFAYRKEFLHAKKIVLVRTYEF